MSPRAQEPKSPIRGSIILLALIVLLLPASVSAQQSERYRPKSGTEILWDSYGVPHIFARDSRSLFYAFGWAQMQSHGDLVLRLYGEARGRAAEYWGPDYLESDRWVWLNDVPDRAERNFGLTRATYQAYLQAFVAGANAYAERFPERLDSTVRVVLPIRPSDVMAHMQRVLHLGFVLAPAGIMPAARTWSEANGGSNAWAIAPGRSESGRALLLANPHLPWGSLFTWYEAQIVSGDVSAYGAALVGFPLLSIGFNERLGWTHTVNTIDAADLYELTLAGDGYRWDGGVRRFETDRVTLWVRRNGNLVADTLFIQRSVHGPVIARQGGKALALRVAGLDQPHLLEQNWRMFRAKSQKDFESALAMLQLPMFTVMYADRGGHIMHVFNGRVPIRSSGGWNEWGRPVRGDTSATLWTRTHAYKELPRIVDPPTGWLQNANDPPWTTTFPLQLDPALYPDYMAPQTPLEFRPQRSIRMLMGDERITFEELIEYKHSTRLEAADHVLGPLLAATSRHGTERARRAAAVLERWDRSADASSRGTLLFQQFMTEAARVRWPGGSMFAVRWNPARPLTTPDGLSDAEEAANVLDRAARVVEETYGALDAAYGGVYRLRRDGVDLPANGASGELGAFRVVDFDSVGRQFIATGGDSYVAAIEFTRPVRAMTLLSYGNASQPGSVHRVDQLPLFSRKELRPAWLRREEILRHLEQRIRF